MTTSDQNYRDIIAHKVLLVMVPVIIVLAIISLLRLLTLDPIPVTGAWLNFGALGALLVIKAALVFNRTRLAGNLFVILLTSVLASGMALNGGIRSLSFLVLIVPLTFSVWIYSNRMVAAIFSGTLVVSAALAYLEYRGLLPGFEAAPLSQHLIVLISVQLIIIGITYLARELLFKALRDVENKNREILESGQKYRDLVEGTDEIITRADGKGQYLFVNHASTKIFGLEPDEMINLFALDFVLPDDKDHTRATFDAIVNAKKISGAIEIRQASRSGAVYDINWRFKFQYDDAGEVIQIDGIGRDITDTRQAEKIQDVLHNISQASVQAADLGTLIELVRNHLGEIIDTTNFYIALYHEETDEYFFPRYFDNFEDHSGTYTKIPGGFTDLVRQTNKSLIVDQQNYREYDKDGGMIIYGVNSLCWLGVPLRTKNGVIGVLALQSYDDPTAYSEKDLKIVDSVADSIANVVEISRANEKELRLKDRLNRAERMETLGLLAGEVAHDLNNILVPIVTYPDIILAQIPDKTEVHADVLEIKKAAERASDIIGDLLTLTRRGDYEMNVLNLNDVISEYISTPGFKSIQNEHAAVTTHLELADDLANISGSSSHLTKIIMNLISNGIHAYSSNGELWVQTRNETVRRKNLYFDEIPDGDYTVMTVIDVGSGISKETLNHIFDPFYSTKSKSPTTGTGLGLSIVNGIAHDHGAFVDVQSAEGEGTTFTIYFPTTQEDLPSQSQNDATPTGTESVLVIDDMENQIKIVTTILATLGYSVTGTVGGRMGVEYLKRNEVDIIVLDMIMEPDFDGLKTFQEILRIHPGQKAIIVSGFSESEKVKQTLALGAGGYLAKPYTVQELGSAVRKILDS